MKEFFFSLKSFNGVSRKFQRCFDEVLRMFHASFKVIVSRVFQESFRGLSWKFEGRFEGALRMFQGRFK